MPGLHCWLPTTAEVLCCVVQRGELLLGALFNVRTTDRFEPFFALLMFAAACSPPETLRDGTDLTLSACATRKRKRSSQATVGASLPDALVVQPTQPHVSTLAAAALSFPKSGLFESIYGSPLLSVISLLCCC